MKKKPFFIMLAITLILCSHPANAYFNDFQSIQESFQDTSIAEVNQTVEDDPFLVETKSAVRLFRDMDNYSSVIFYIPPGETVEVFEEVDDYFSAKYNSEKGYILKSKVKPLNFELGQDNTEELNKNSKKDRRTYLTGKYDEKTAQALYDHKIWKGMTTKMTKDSWGYPKTMDRYLRVGESIEDWHYSKYTLVFSDGKLIRWGKNK
jgi:hypothetical protein